MNICKILDLHPGLEMSSWGTVHFPEEERILEYYIQIENTQWKGLRYDSCKRAPKGGFDEVRQGHEYLIAEWSRNTEHKIQLQMICKEDVSVDEVVRLVLGELQKSGFPYSLEKEAGALRRRLEICGRVPVKKGKRF
jgi:hypothetical protein